MKWVLNICHVSGECFVEDVDFRILLTNQDICNSTNTLLLKSMYTSQNLQNKS